MSYESYERDEEVAEPNPPDQDEDAWMYDGSQPPSQSPPAGYEWVFGHVAGSSRPVWHTNRAPDPVYANDTNNHPPQRPVKETTADEPRTAPSGPSGRSGYMGDRRALSDLNYPMFDAPDFVAPPPFTYEAFVAPTLSEAQSEPGFEFAMQQGLKAMENSKAYLGTYRTGGTIKGLNDYARNMANQNYNDVFRRKGETYDRNRENAADSYVTNYGISRDVFDRHYTGARDEYSSRARAAELKFARDWDLYTYEGDEEYRRWKAQVDANS